MSAKMKFVASLLLMTTVVSCVPISLGDPEKSKSHKEYVGLWMWDSGSSIYLFDVQQFDSRAYIIDWMEFNQKAGVAKRRQLVKAWTTDFKGTRILTLKMLRVDAGNNPSQKTDTLTMGKLVLKKHRLSLHLLKEDAFKNVKTPRQMHQFLEKRHKDAAIYDGALKLVRVKKSDARAKRILAAFHRK